MLAFLSGQMLEEEIQLKVVNRESRFVNKVGSKTRVEEGKRAQEAIREMVQQDTALQETEQKEY